MVEVYDPYFVQKTNDVGIIGLSSLQKMTAAMRMLAYGVATDSVDDYLRIGESTAIERLKHFVKAMVAMFSERRRFWMNRSLFLHILSIVEAYDSYFVQKTNDVGIIGLSSLQKMTATMRMLTYGVAADSVDDYLRIGESTAIERLKHFVKAVVAMFSERYLRSPNNDDISRLLAIGSNRGFPGMLGSIDSMHWKWKNCPTARKGRAPLVNYLINRNDYIMGYYLADGIYLQWATFVKTVSSSQGNKEIYFAKAQESAMTDVERASGVLQARFAIVKGSARFWKRK
ncbi:uncharacterized protein LOC114311046 [Camellia sinensis]|uniref:uncharacterized protein LOC114311046 n=1 Tax=Camellia sinensis TaxID=4442 RepID=UPI00103564A4|nr:uncharacterized protein LOC114311046 [Camellia sinensis]